MLIPSRRIQEPASSPIQRPFRTPSSWIRLHYPHPPRRLAPLRDEANRLSFLVVLLGPVLLALWLNPSPLAYAQEPTPELTPVVEPTPVPPPEPPEPSDSGGGGLFGLLPDPKEWAAEVFTQVLTQLLQGVNDALRRVVDGVISSSLNFITQTPPAGSYESPTVHTLWNVVRLVANAAVALVALWGGFNLMVREHIGAPYHDAMELFPRLAIGTLLLNTSLSWGRLAIDLNNALCLAIGETRLPAWEQADPASSVFVDVLSILIYLVASLLLLLQMLMRLALIDMLLVVSPIALLCWVLPQTQGWARLWSNTFFAAVFTQFVQVVTLKLGGSLLTDLTPMAADAALLSVFLGVAVLALTLKIPSLMRSQAGDGLGFARYLAYRQGAQLIMSRGGASRRQPGGS